MVIVTENLAKIFFQNFHGVIWGGAGQGRVSVKWATYISFNYFFYIRLHHIFFLPCMASFILLEDGIIPCELQGMITSNENIIETELRIKAKDKNPLDEKPNRANKLIGEWL